MVAFTRIVVAATLAFAAGSAIAAEPAANASPARTLLDWYEMGGGLMHGIALCSVLIVGTVLERCFALRSSATIPSRLRQDMVRALAVGNFSELKRLAEGRSSALVRLAGQALDPIASTEAVAAAGAFEAHRLMRNLPLLSALGNLATMVGLLGTVLGMLDAFDRIALVGSGDARVVAGGIFLALITTAAGLFAAILAVAAHAWLSRRAEDRVAELEGLTSAIRESIETGHRIGRIGSDPDREAREGRP